MASVELRRVTKVYPNSGTTRILDDLSLSVDDGELLVLLGPNGSGKTTLLRLIAGLERVTSGEVLIGGEVVNDWPPRRRDVGMVFQSGVLYPHLTVEKNLTFGIGNEGGIDNEGGTIGWIWSRLANRAGSHSGERSDEQGRPDKQYRPDEQYRTALQDRVRETAQLLGIESLLNRLPRQLSGGERQRVALGRALVRQPAVFLLDEPLANADTKLRQEMRSAFQRARQRFPGTMILVSHDHSEALALGQRIAVLGHGKVQQIGLARDVFATPKNRFVAEFLGRWSTTFIEGEWRRENGKLWLATECGPLQVPESFASKLASLGSRTGLGTRVSLGLRVGAVKVHGSDSISETAWTEVAWTEVAWRGVVRWVEFREESMVACVALPRTEPKTQPRTPSDQEQVSPGQTAQKETAQEVTVVALVTDPGTVRTGDLVALEIDWSRAIWFDANTGSNLLELT